jgi:adenylate cyclase
MNKSSYILQFFCVFMLFTDLPAFAQQNGKNTDSLERLIAASTTDTGKLNLIGELFNDCISTRDSSLGLRFTKEYHNLAYKTGIELYKLKAEYYYAMYYLEFEHDYEKAAQAFEHCASSFKENRYPELAVAAYMGLADAYRANSKNNLKALQSYRTAIELHPEIELVRSINGNMGDIYKTIGDYNNALACYERVFLFLEQKMASKNGAIRNDTLESIYTLINIANIHIILNEYSKAIEHFNRADALNRNIDLKSLAVMILEGLGKCALLQNDLDVAMTYYEKALAKSQEKRGETDRGNVLNNIANIYVERKDLQKASDYAAQALTFMNGANKNEDIDRSYLPDTYAILAKIDAAKKDFKAAIDHLNTAIDLYHKTTRMDDESRAWQQLSTTYEQMSDPAHAYSAYKHFISLRDSIFNQEKVRDITRIEMQGDFDRRMIKDSLAQAKKDITVKQRMNRQRTITYGGFAGLAVVLLVAFFIYRNYSNEKKANVEIKRANEVVKGEKEKSDKLLLNILPAEVARELKNSGSVAAKYYDPVTVLFTDFENFTAAGERLSAPELVQELDTCFRAFDAIIAKYNIEKIKTVGDSYLAVSGLPHPNPRHAQEIVQAGIEIRDFMLLRLRELGDRTFSMRIGIHSGPVVAGVVGTTKFAYDVWGDTVNTANRMEGSGEAGKINISEATYLLVKDEFECSYRGEITAKNKGMLKMYFVETPEPLTPTP